MGDSRRKASQSAVTAIAVRRVFGVLAIAEPDLFAFLKGELLWTHPGTFVAAVTKWLVTGKTAGAPEMVAGGQFNGTGFGVVDFGKIAHEDHCKRALPGMQGVATSAASAPWETGSPNFHAWEMRGVYPKILTHALHGEEPIKLFADAQRILEDLIQNDRVHARAVWGVWPASSTGEDVPLFTDDTRTELLRTFHFLRQQKEKVKPGTPFQSLADFVAPLASGRADDQGVFAVTAGNEVEEYAKTFRDKHDDYPAILIQGLADRFAEGLAELLHRIVRRFICFGITEDLAVEDLIQERYRGIRPNRVKLSSS